MSELHIEARSARFFDLYARGEVSPGDIDDFVARWHEGRDPGVRDLSLHEYLGMSRDEYEVWLCDPFALPEMLRARLSRRPLAGAMQARHAALRAANRQQDAAILYALGNWLDRHTH